MPQQPEGMDGVSIPNPPAPPAPAPQPQGQDMPTPQPPAPEPQQNTDGQEQNGQFDTNSDQMIGMNYDEDPEAFIRKGIGLMAQRTNQYMQDNPDDTDVAYWAVRQIDGEIGKYLTPDQIEKAKEGLDDAGKKSEGNEEQGNEGQGNENMQPDNNGQQMDSQAPPVSEAKINRIVSEIFQDLINGTDDEDTEKTSTKKGPNNYTSSVW